MPTSISMESIIDRDSATLHIPTMVRSDEYGLKTEVPGRVVEPKTVIPIDKPHKLTKPGSKAAFTIRRFLSGFYSCTCPAWQYSTERDKLRKSCSHLDDVLGSHYEEERLRVAKEAPSSVWETQRHRKSTTATSSIASRLSTAKNLLDAHIQESSQRESPPAPSQDKGAGIDAPVASTSSTTVQPPAALNGNEDDDGSDTEAEEDAVAVRPSTPTRKRGPAPEDDWEGFHPVEHPSPSKKGPGRLEKGKDGKFKLLLAHPFVLYPDPSKPSKKVMDASGWWMSEKLDGVRAFWDGQRLWSRQALEWNAPAWWKDRLPKDITLDGELWLRRGGFDETSQICRTTVRMGRIRTFKHFLQRDPLERAWLREQLGGRLASQHRIRREEEACRHPRCSTAVVAAEEGQESQTSASALGDITNLPPPTTVTPLCSSSGKRRSPWKARKRAILHSSVDDIDSGEISVLRLAQLSLRTLLSPRPRSAGQPDGAPKPACSRCGRRKRRARTPQRSALSKDDPVERVCRKRKRSEAKTPRHPRPSFPSSFSLFSQTTAAAGATVMANSSIRSATPSSSSSRIRRNPDCIGVTSPRSRRRRTHLHPANFLPSFRSDRKRSDEWRQIKFMVFDAPSVEGKVEERWAELEKRFGSTYGTNIDELQGAVIKAVHHEKCIDREHMLSSFAEVQRKGGEGLMLRKPESHYVFGRSTTLLKLKPFYDAEARVVNYVDGEGRNSDRVGALVVEMQSGLLTRIGSGMSDWMRENPPPLGSIINYRFQEIGKNGHPRHPVFRGVAVDKSRPKDAVVGASARRVDEDEDR